MKHTFYATKDVYPSDATISKGTKPLVGKGEVLMTIDTPVELDRAVAAISNGAATLDKPKPANGNARPNGDAAGAK